MVCGRDVRWDNVVHGGVSSRAAWFLIDLETVWAAGQVRYWCSMTGWFGSDHNIVASA